MAALQPLAEGPNSSSIATKSFSQLFTQQPTSPISVRPPSKYKGEAAVVFSKEEAEKLAAPFRWALVGKFSHGQPSLEETRKFFATLNLKDQISVGLMDYRHVLIKCTAEADFNRIWTRGIWQLGKYPMRVFRWTRDFHVHKESSLAPVWISLPALPIHYFDKHSLFSILSSVGKPLFSDSATAAGTRPSVTRVCVEVDLLKPACSRVWIAVEGELGFWQKIAVDDMPKYCTACWRLGHSLDECKVHNGGTGASHKQRVGVQTLKSNQFPVIGNAAIQLNNEAVNIPTAVTGTDQEVQVPDKDTLTLKVDLEDVAHANLKRLKDLIS